MMRYAERTVPSPTATIVEARVGFSGLVTRQLAFLAMLGWNSSFYEARAA